MWDDKKFFEDFVRESKEIKPDADFVEKIVEMTKTEKNEKIISLSTISKVAATAAAIFILVTVSGIGFRQQNNRDNSDITKPSLQAAGSETTSQGKGQAGKIEEIVDDKLITVKAMLKDDECQIKDDSENEISEEEREELLSKIEQAEKLDELPENAGEVVSYTLIGETMISVQIVDDEYLIID